MRVTKPTGCFRSCSSSLWKALEEVGRGACIGQGKTTPTLVPIIMYDERRTDEENSSVESHCFKSSDVWVHHFKGREMSALISLDFWEVLLLLFISQKKYSEFKIFQNIIFKKSSKEGKLKSFKLLFKL
jgi:hypothetical protein